MVRGSREAPRTRNAWLPTIHHAEFLHVVGDVLLTMVGFGPAIRTNICATSREIRPQWSCDGHCKHAPQVLSRLRADLELAFVNVVVTDPHNRVIAGLDADSFEDKLNKKASPSPSKTFPFPSG